MNQTELLALIQRAKDEQWTELDLRGQGLEELPPEIGELEQIEVLRLGSLEESDSHNCLTSLPDSISWLINLHTLDLSNNRLGSLPKSIIQLTKLRTLDLRQNHLRNLPRTIGQLTSLHNLCISQNSLSQLPNSIGQLTNLYTLNLSDNWLNNLPKSIIQLTKLRTLNLSQNRLKSLPRNMDMLADLQTLDISDNSLYLLPDWMSKLIYLHTLDLNNNNLSQLPIWIDQLINLHTLNLKDNNLSQLPSRIVQLTSLEALDVSGNNLSKLPDWMAQLTSLYTLNLGDNSLNELPIWISQLTNLHTLDLGHNYLEVLPDSMSQLTNLHTLDLRYNSLSHLPDWMAQLVKLQILDVSGNRLSHLPDWMADRKKLPSLKHLSIGRNPLVIPPIEVLGEVLEQSYKNADLTAIRNYFRQLQEETATYFYEAKLLIIGEGGAGKTSLARKLIEPDCDLLPDKGSTQGVDILHWSFPLPPDQPGEATDYTANVWDFGGQEIYFATHQFFLTHRSVYVLVADTRRQHTDFYTWLKMQETFGAESPVLLLKNLNRNMGNAFTIQNLHHLRDRFPNLKEVIEVDLNEAPNLAGWDDLLHHLKDYLLSLEHIGQPRPRTWVDVRKAVDAHTADTLEWQEFVTLCQEQGMKRDEDIAQLADYLHNLGDILHFRDDPFLCDLVILKPTWGLDAVYKVLDNQEIINRLGQFDLTDLRKTWREVRYQGFQLALLRLMQNFQLCYPLEGVPDTYIAPQLLTTDVPDYRWDRHENLQMRYHYPVFMPRGILSRAIVKLHQRIETQDLVWRSGVILNNGHARAEVLEIWGERQIRIRVSGQHKRDLLMEVVRALDELHRSFPKLRFERQIPCNCKTCAGRDEPYFYDFQKVYDRAADRASKGTIECGYRPYADVPLYSLLNDVAAQGLLSGMSERERQVVHDNRIYNINSGGGAVVAGAVETNGGNFTGRDSTKQQIASIDPAQVEQALVQLFALQAAKPTDQASAFETVQALMAEACKGSEADDEALAGLIRRFVELVPIGANTVVAVFGNPPLVEIVGVAAQAVLDEMSAAAE